ncbi:MAG: hypothetical protein Q8P61_05910, partial [Candidatus Nanopelagicales bacterium]|nr:hypothetical protein [Candidatus Nanopelagicales bacterium]
MGRRWGCTALVVGVVGSTFAAPAWSAEPLAPDTQAPSIVASDPVTPGADRQGPVETMDPTVVEADVISLPRRENKPGVHIGNVRVTNRGKKVIAPIRWSKKLLKGPSRKDRFSVRLVAFPGADATPRVLATWSTTSV